jgi:hypothetical protein
MPLRLQIFYDMSSTFALNEMKSAFQYSCGRIPHSTGCFSPERSIWYPLLEILRKKPIVSPSEIKSSSAFLPIRYGKIKRMEDKIRFEKRTLMIAQHHEVDLNLSVHE